MLSKTRNCITVASYSTALKQSPSLLDESTEIANQTRVQEVCEKRWRAAPPLSYRRTQPNHKRRGKDQQKGAVDGRRLSARQQKLSSNKLRRRGGFHKIFICGQLRLNGLWRASSGAIMRANRVSRALKRDRPAWIAPTQSPSPF